MRQSRVSTSAPGTPRLRLRAIGNTVKAVAVAAVKKSPRGKLSDSFPGLRISDAQPEAVDLARSGPLAVSFPVEPGQLKEQKEHFLSQIDQLIKAKLYDDAKQKIAQAIKQCGRLIPFYERMLRILREDETQETIDCLTRLLWDSCGDERIYYLAKKLFSMQRIFDVGIYLAELYAKRGKLQKSSHLLLSLAKEHANASDDVSKCLDRLKVIPEFTEQDLKMLYLLGLSVDRVNNDLLNDRSMPVELAAADCTGDAAFFLCDHPQYVACWMNLEMQIRFTKDRAEVYVFTEAASQLVPLIFPPEVPDEVRISSAGAVRWLLGTGYSPTIVDEGISFTRSQESPGKNVVLQKANSLARGLKDQNLTDFIHYFSEANYGLAHAAIQKIKDKRVWDLLAEFYAFLKRPEAITIFLDKSNGDDALYYLQRALAVSVAIKDDRAYGIFLKIENILGGGHLHKEQHDALCLYAFLYFTLRKQNEGAAGVFYEKASLPFRSLARVASLGRPKEFTKPEVSNKKVEEAFRKYSRVRQKLVDWARDLNICENLEGFFVEESFEPRLAAMRDVCSEIRDLSQQAKGPLDVGDELNIWLDLLIGRIEKIQEFHEGVDAALENQQYKEAKKILLLAADCCSHQENLLRKNAYLELERVPRLSPFYGAKNVCDDERKPQALSDAFDKIIDVRLKKIAVEDALSGLRIDPPSCTITTLSEKCKAIRGAPDCFKECQGFFEANQAGEAEVCILRAIDESASESVKKRIKDLYFHLLVFLNREEAISYGFELLQERAQPQDLTNSRSSQGWVRPVPNSLYIPITSEELSYLELMLELSLRLNHPRLLDVYKRIEWIFVQKKVPAKVVTLLHLHGFFHYLDRDRKVAEEFFKKIDEKHPLYPFACLARLHRKAKSSRQLCYNTLTAFFEDPDKVKEYLGDNATSSLELFVHEKCLQVFKNEQMQEIKKLGLVFVDTLLERGSYERAEDMIRIVLARLHTFTSHENRYSHLLDERFKQERFSFLKREAVISMAQGQARKTVSVLRKLRELYEKHRKPERSLLCSRLLYKHVKDQDAFYELVRAASPEESVSLCLDNAVRSLAANQLSDARVCIDTLRGMRLSSDERIMFDLLQALCSKREDAVLASGVSQMSLEK